MQIFQFSTVTVDKTGKVTQQEQKEAKYLVEDLGNGVTLEMVQIPRGTFMMGSPKTEAGRYDNESPQHQVTVPAFLMGKYLVTQSQYQIIMETNPARFKGKNRPVEKVSWDDAVKFCEKLSQRTGKTYRLPSEAEWEYACRAGTATPFYFGETITTDLVNYDGNSSYASVSTGVCRRETTEVGKLPPNAFGLYDMYGNVWEWCQDTWHSNYNNAPSDGSAWIDNNHHQSQVLRGGSWDNYAVNCRSAFRSYYYPIYNFDMVGFRLVCGVP
ncbi:formylglycine-generating enzyme family protein [Calothrix sp. PCC 6303]|uniref:formylglycine-generating enzyme family protein n=1 Tax=Calothrix sp. PCC 6303 TaxID=1170562 RepID=UPI0002A0498B|nr:Sulphatase-modifying factor protein [Calothrix sp. PCC 6303]